MADLDAARTIVSQSCRIIGKMDMTREPAGHVSYRIPGTDYILIKARGAGEAALRYVTPDDLIICDMDGKKIDGRDDPGQIHASHLERDRVHELVPGNEERNEGGARRHVDGEHDAG